ncbi:MAG TPA: xanthine dehydrogenase family protein molybdopterin-binding subunit [Pseudolabrys sp.]|nr:xanthine dehydrogenase family protein molybdopterin-binding subunit [Pseudolabrys sp.]
MNLPLAHRKAEPRLEDDALVRGAGQFMDDPQVENLAHAVFVRSPHAHARIVSINADEARKGKGVLAVLTAADMTAAGVKAAGRSPPMTGRGGKEMIQPFRPVLAGERVCYVGEAVIAVVAETRALAQDAADLVTVDYEELPAVVEPRAALKKDAPQVHPEAPGNLALDWPGPLPGEENEREVDKIIAGAAHVARVTVLHQRLVVASMETRGATGMYDKEHDNYTLHACSQSAGGLRNNTATVMGLPNEKLRVLTADVGGAFGMKSPVYPEYPVVLVAAKTIGRPVRWQSTRSEAFMTDTQGRDAVTETELALDANGKFLALRMRHICGEGAYITPAGGNINTMNVARCLPCMYRIPKIAFSSLLVFTNTAPIGPYRGAGRPEANYALDRAVEEAARISGIDTVQLRRKNLIPPSSMPYKTAVGTTYDSGDFPGVFAKAMELSDYKSFNKRKRASAKARKLRGVGISCMLEHAGATPTESAGILFPGGGKLILRLNVQSTGQAHATVFGRLLADKLGIDPHLIEHRHGDSAFDLVGNASVGSRSAMAAGHAIVHTADVMLEKGKKVASALLEASVADIQYRNGSFEVVGTDRMISLFETARRAKETGESLDTKEKTDTPLTFPNGVHIAEVEIDPETGHVDVATYTAVDDCGNMLNPMIVEGQVQGSLANGFGQALLEDVVYDAGGQLVTGSFMDYAMPHAHDMPVEFREAVLSTPATTNPLGVKGTGEAGTTAAIAALMNAIAHAIPNGAGDHMDMPATPAKVWAACQKGMGK